MSLLDTIKNLLGGADEHAQNAGGEALQSLENNETAQVIKDKSADLTGQAGEVGGAASEKVQGVIDEVKNKLGL